VFAATVHAEQMTESGDDYNALMTETLSQRLAEACVEKMHEVVRKEIWGYAQAEHLAVADILAEKYVGLRPAVGYPSLPDLSLNFDLDGVIDFGEIGISLTENGMMSPQASVSGLLFAHPLAQHFAVGKIGDDQLADYASRRGQTLADIRRYLKH
jgi:cobalamin-dependent methionine synthase I